MDVLFIFFVLNDMSLSLLPKQLIAKIVQFCMLYVFLCGSVVEHCVS